jgi:hypothetical protein
MKRGLKIVDNIAKKARGKGVYRLRLANGQFTTTGRTVVGIRGKARLAANYKNTVAETRSKLDRALRSKGRMNMGTRPLAFEVINGTNLADNSAKAVKVVQKAHLAGKTGKSARDIRKIVAERNKRLRDRQNIGNKTRYAAPGVSASAQAYGTWRGINWSANINWNNRKLQTGIAVLSAGAILKGGYELYEKNRRGQS